MITFTFVSSFVARDVKLVSFDSRLLWLLNSCHRCLDGRRDLLAPRGGIPPRAAFVTQERAQILTDHAEFGSRVIVGVTDIRLSTERHLCRVAIF